MFSILQRLFIFIFLKNVELSYVVMPSKRATVALFTIAVASSLLLSNSFVGSAFAAKKKVYREDDDFYIQTDKDSLKSSRVNTDDLSGDTEDEEKNLNSRTLSKCEAAATADGHLTLAEQRECYRVACNDDN